MFLTVEQERHCPFAGSEGPPELVASQRTATGAEHVEHTEAGRADLQRQREHRPDSGLDHSRCVDRPPPRRTVVEMRNQDGAVLGSGVDARALTEGELQLLDAFGPRVRRDRHSQGAVGSQHTQADTTRCKMLYGVAAYRAQPGEHTVTRMWHRVRAGNVRIAVNHAGSLNL